MPAKKKVKTEKKADEPLNIIVIINGLPGAMGQEIAKVCAKRQFKLADFALTGPNMPELVDVEGVKVRLIDTSKDGATEKFKEEVEKLRKDNANASIVVIDFTHPDGVNKNADIYNEIELPFVMGTTGGDREKLLKSTQESKNHAVIAPNMCKQIVAFQAMMEYMENNFPGAFAGYELTVTESHQKTKADTSGTAKAVVKSLAALNAKEFPEENIKKLRTDEDSINFGVPKEFLSGHAHHTYHLKSGDATVDFEFKHNVNGRSTYAEGVADAVAYLATRISNPRNKPKIYNMIDVLKSGAMS